MMKQALVLISVASKYPGGLPELLKKIDGVTDAKFIYGPYDLYAFIEAKTHEGLRDVVLQIRNMDGIQSTITCTVLPTHGTPVAS
jgi:hypothetical protein